MPTKAESLNPNSSESEIQKALSDSIEQLMKEGNRTHEQCIAIAHSQAEKAVGRSITRKSITV
jgi:hypothetical protein